MKKLLYFILIIPMAVFAADLKITWDANTEDDLAGYNLSYDSPTSDRWETSCSAYEYSSMGLEYNTTYTIEDCSVGDYSIYVRAYDTSGNMSGYNAYACIVSSTGEGVYSVTTQGIEEPTNCVPVATIIYPHGGSPMTVTLRAIATNNPTSFDWEVYKTTTPEEYTTSGINETFDSERTYYVRVTATNATWFGQAWATIRALINPPTRCGGGGRGGTAGGN